MVGAWLLGTRIVLHEQNILPGITNRILARFADRIYISFEDTKTRFDPQKIRLTGNPVRKELLNDHGDHSNDAAIASKSFCVLIIGGSQVNFPSIPYCVASAQRAMRSPAGTFTRG